MEREVAGQDSQRLEPAYIYSVLGFSQLGGPARFTMGFSARRDVGYVPVFLLRDANDFAGQQVKVWIGDEHAFAGQQVEVLKDCHPRL